MRPVPLGVELTAIGWEKSLDGRKHLNAAEIRDATGQVLAKSEGLFIAIAIEKMFAGQRSQVGTKGRAEEKQAVK